MLQLDLVDLGPDFRVNQAAFAPLDSRQVSEKPYGSSMASWQRDPAADDLAIKKTIGACNPLGEREMPLLLTIPSIAKHWVRCPSEP
jgi:hypothetical protein